MTDRGLEIVRMSAEERAVFERRRRQRNLAILLVLVALAVLTLVDGPLLRAHADDLAPAVGHPRIIPSTASAPHSSATADLSLIHLSRCRPPPAFA